jgi:hypothetical protein
MRNFQEMLKSEIEMKYPNESLCLHEGTFNLLWKDVNYTLQGKLVFK